MRAFTPIDNGSLKGMLEALLLVSSEAASARELAEPLEADPQAVEVALQELSQEYADTNRGFQLRQVAGGWRLFSHPAYFEQVERYVTSWDKSKLSQAALETLAVIAYHQPISREGVRSIRGVNSDGVIASLKGKGYVRESGKDEHNAVLLATTKAFLDALGLRSISDLPPLADFAPDEASRQFIRDRLSGAGTQDATVSSLDEEEDE